MTQLFAVFREGVYRHQCGGIFSTKDDAIACAKHLAASDSDAYHTYEVLPFVLDQRLPIEPASKPPGYWHSGSPDILEADAIYTCRQLETPK